jgi:hypothetical protein
MPPAAKVKAVKPLPPPIPVAGVTAAPGGSDPMNLDGLFPPGESSAASAAQFVDSSTTEPKPGEPLSPESEELLGGIGAGAESDDGDQAGEPLPPSLLPSIAFSEKRVRAVLTDGFDWLAERFDSDHWKLTDNQADMLSEPTAVLLGSLWSHVQRMLPLWLERWSETTPGLMDFALMAGIVLTPKILTQAAISRRRRHGPVPIDGKRPAQPRPVPAPPRDGPVGPIDTTVEPLPFTE